VQYNRCRENALLSISAFAADLIAFSRENRPERVVFDVRENSGGSSIWFTRLLDALGGAYQSGQLSIPPKWVYGIIGKRTFSSGSLAVRDMKAQGFILVGETTGGRVYWFGENTPYTLPNSRLTVGVSTKFVGTQPIPEIEPDVPVVFNGADYFANRDPYLEAVLRLDAPPPSIVRSLFPAPPGRQ
jgi:C-terminal processing protease CtpA/Prc